MSEESLALTLAAESHTEETRSLIKQVRRITRRRFTPEEKISIVLEGFRHEVPIRGLCPREGIEKNRILALVSDSSWVGRRNLTQVGLILLSDSGGRLSVKCQQKDFLIDVKPLIEIV